MCYFVNDVFVQYLRAIGDEYSKKAKRFEFYLLQHPYIIPLQWGFLRGGWCGIVDKAT